jgi:APA family basic amino acid/polyamine antiporter
VLALFVPLEELSDLTSMGALFAFCVVCAGVMFRRYYQPPSAYDRGVTGLTGTEGKPLWMVLTLLLTVVGSSLAVGFGWATHCHWALYAVGGAVWFVATAVMWVFLPVVFKPATMPAPLCPWWPSAGIFSTIFLIASLGPLNWERWGYGCILGIALFGAYGVAEYFYNRKYGPPLPGLNHDDSAESEWPKEGGHGASKDLEIGRMGSGSGDGSTPKSPDFKETVQETAR